MDTDNTPKRGRPVLNEADPTVKVSYFFTQGLLARIKRRAHDLGLRDSEVVRGTLTEFLHQFRPDETGDRVTIPLTGTDISKAIARAAKAWELSAEAVVKMALLRGLSDITKEGEALKKGLAK